MANRQQLERYIREYLCEAYSFKLGNDTFEYKKVYSEDDINKVMRRFYSLADCKGSGADDNEAILGWYLENPKIAQEIKDIASSMLRVLHYKREDFVRNNRAHTFKKFLKENPDQINYIIEGFQRFHELINFNKDDYELAMKARKFGFYQWMWLVEERMKVFRVAIEEYAPKIIWNSKSDTKEYESMKAGVILVHQYGINLKLIGKGEEPLPNPFWHKLKEVDAIAVTEHPTDRRLGMFKLYVYDNYKWTTF